MTRAIDSEAAYRFLSEQLVKETGAFSKGVNKGLNIARSAMRNPDAIPTLTPPNEWVSVEDNVPDPGERVLATDGIFVGEAYRTSADSWHRHTGFPWRDGVTGRTVKYWMLLPAPPGKDNNVLAKTPNEALTLERLREMDGEPVWFDTIKRWGIVKVNREGIFVVTKSGEYEFGRCKVYRRPPEEDT